MFIEARNLRRCEVALHVAGFVLASLLAARPTSAASSHIRVQPKVAAHHLLAPARLGWTMVQCPVPSSDSRGRRRSLHRFARLKQIEKFVQYLQVLARAIGITELYRDTEMARRAMRHAEQRKHPPRVRILAARLPIVSIGLQDRFEPLFRHIGPGKGDAGRDCLLRRGRQLIEKVVCNDSEVSSPRATACAKQLGIVLVIHPARNHLTPGIDRQNVCRRKPVRRQTLQSRQQPVPAAADMTAGTHRTACASWQRHVVVLIQVGVGAPELRSGRDPIFRRTG